VGDSYTTTDQSNAWSVKVTSAQATALADGSYTVTANVSDLAGNPAPQASKALTVDEDKVPEPPILTIANTALNVNAGGSVALGITATPVDPDDRVSVKISGLPSYETITAPSGDTVSRQFNLLSLSYTYTITESASAAGTPLTGLTLTSHYTGTGHPVANLTVTASNITSGETATSASQALKVTDPPVATSSSSPATSSPGPIQLAALFDQFVAAGLHSQNGTAQIVTTSQIQGAGEVFGSLANPHH
jgi:Bacterial Ig-like domain